VNFPAPKPKPESSEASSASNPERKEEQA
jgi:hypothetical protein